MGADMGVGAYEVCRCVTGNGVLKAEADSGAELRLLHQLYGGGKGETDSRLTVWRRNAGNVDSRPRETAERPYLSDRKEHSICPQPIHSAAEGFPQSCSARTPGPFGGRMVQLLS